LQPILRQELANTPGSLTMIFLAEKIEHKSFSPELQATIDAHPEVVGDTSFFGPGYELRQQIIREAMADAKASSFAERERLVHKHFDKFLSQLGFWALFLGTFGLLDLLWIGLGTWTAWTLGQGRI
jgi:hypothetical protein